MTAPNVLEKDDPEFEAILLSLQQIRDGKYFFLAAATMLVYDHLLTFSEEVTTIWKRKKSYVPILFLVVRYYAVAAVTVVISATFSTALTRELCVKWMLFSPLGLTVPLTILPGILMIVRVYALWDRNKIVLYGLSAYLCAQTGVGLWQYTVKGGTAAPLPLDNYEYHFCIYLPPKRIGRASTTFIMMELAFDSMVFILTISRTTYLYICQRHARRLGALTSGLIQSLTRDGAIYFGAIFSVNLAWVLMILYAPTGLRAISSLPSACVTTTMICRISLSLRTTAYGPAQINTRATRSDPPSDPSYYTPRRPLRSGSLPQAHALEIGVHVDTRYDGAKESIGVTHAYGHQDEPPFSSGDGFGLEKSPAPPAGAYIEPGTPSPSPLTSTSSTFAGSVSVPLLARFTRGAGREVGNSAATAIELEDLGRKRRMGGDGDA